MSSGDYHSRGTLVSKEVEIIDNVIDLLSEESSSQKLKILMNLTVSLIAVQSTSTKDFNRKLKNCTNKMLKETNNYWIQDKK